MNKSDDMIELGHTKKSLRIHDFNDKTTLHMQIELFVTAKESWV